MSGDPIRLQITGLPSPQGSKRGLLNRHTGKVVVIEGGSTTGREKLKSWRAAVIEACEAFIAHHEAEGYGAWLPLAGPLSLSVDFVMPRPKHVPKARLGWPMTPPDVFKLVRATEDALTLGLLYCDDAQICQYLGVEKRYAGPDGWTGATLIIETLDAA